MWRKVLCQSCFDLVPKRISRIYINPILISQLEHIIEMNETSDLSLFMEIAGEEII
jgi:hypothetical protein